MTREEAERVAAMLVTVKPAVADVGFDVIVAGHWTRRERARANADIAAGYSRDAIVRTLMGVG